MDNDTKQEQSTTAEPTTEPQGEDWEAKYKDAIAHSRTWEKRAKENQRKADELDKIEEANKTELEKARSRAEKAEEQLAVATKAAERQKMLMQVSEKTGVPASLLQGDTVEELEGSAKAITDFATKTRVGFPADKGGSPTPPTVTKEQIDGIKDPLARVRARAANAKLYE